MDGDVRIVEAAKQLGVSAQHLRILEWEGKVPLARRDFNGRLYSHYDIDLLRQQGVGSRPRKLKSPGEVLVG